MKRKVISAIALLSLAASAAHGQETGAELGMTIEEAAAVFADQSFPATVIDAYTLTAEAGNHSFDVEGLNCGETRCTEFVFSTVFDAGGGVSLERINQWNYREPAGRAFLGADGAPMLDHVISVSGPDDADVFYGGVLLWLEALEAFGEYLAETAAS